MGSATSKVIIGASMHNYEVFTVRHGSALLYAPSSVWNFAGMGGSSSFVTHGCVPFVRIDLSVSGVTKSLLVHLVSGALVGSSGMWVSYSISNSRPEDTV